MRPDGNRSARPGKKSLVKNLRRTCGFCEKLRMTLSNHGVGAKASTLWNTSSSRSQHRNSKAALAHWIPAMASARALGRRGDQEIGGQTTTLPPIQGEASQGAGLALGNALRPAGVPTGAAQQMDANCRPFHEGVRWEPLEVRIAIAQKSTPAAPHTETAREKSRSKTWNWPRQASACPRRHRTAKSLRTNQQARPMRSIYADDDATHSSVQSMHKNALEKHPKQPAH